MGSLLPLILLVAVAAVLWKVLSKRQAPATRRERDASSAEPRSDVSEHHWQGTGDFEFEVVGESNYQRALESLAGAHGTEGAETRHRATLLLEDKNKHDPKAVAVQIGGATVAYLSREDARSYRRRLGAKRLSGVNATCDALIVGGGTRRSGEKLFYGVKLDIKPFE